MDIQSIRGQSIVDKAVLRKLLSMIEERPLSKDDGKYEIGYEAAKRDMRRIMLEALPVHKRKTPFQELLAELRNDT